MSAIDQIFANLRTQQRKAFIPFLTAGDPDLEFTGEVVQEMARRGCSICELGIPYSDPIADGPVIQASYTRALANRIQVSQIFEQTTGWSENLAMPLVTMVSYAIIYRQGLEQYVSQAKAAGIAGAIVPDLLVDEADAFAEICRREDFSLIQLVTPTTPRERAVQIAESSSGFLYYVSVTGITGEHQQLPAELTDNVAWLKEQTDLPICIGFGISQPEHVQLLGSVADGIIVGSAIVRKFAEIETRTRPEVVKSIGDFVESLLSTLNPAQQENS